jgi:putative flippase GtrA
MRMLSSGLRFIAVGLTAAAVHFTCFWAFTRGASIHPLLANALAFGVAFAVSFVGHHRLSFADHDQPLLQSLRRFGVTSLLGLLTSEAVLAVVWRWLGWPDWLGVVLGQGVAAVQTFALGRWWAFARTSHAAPDQPQATP